MSVDIERKNAIINLKNQGKTFAYIGELLGLSRQRVHQIYSNNKPNAKKTYKSSEEKRAHSRAKNRARWSSIKDNQKVRAKHRDYCREYHNKTRVQAIMALGGVCAKCGFDDMRALQIDHIEGGGTKDRANGSMYSRYKWIVINIDAAKKKYQVLCANHNWIKRYENGEIPRFS